MTGLEWTLMILACVDAICLALVGFHAAHLAAHLVQGALAAGVVAGIIVGVIWATHN